MTQTIFMHNLANVWWSWMQPMAVQLVVLAAVLAGLTWLLRRRSARLRYALWLLVPLRLVAPPGLAFVTGWSWWLLPSNPSPASPTVAEATAMEAPLARRQPVANPAPVPSPVMAPPQSNSPIAPSPQAPSAAAALQEPKLAPLRMDETRPTASNPSAPSDNLRAAGFPWKSWLFGGWLLGAAFLFLRLFVGGWRAWRLVQQAEPVEDKIWNQALRRWRQSCGIRRQVHLRWSRQAPVPMVVGCRRPTILLPWAIDKQLSAQELEAVLVHELQHVARRDPLVNLLQSILGALYFFHPLVWLANSRLSRLREDACDEATIAALNGRRRAYGAGIVKVAEIVSGARPQLALGVVESGGQVKRRLQRILDPRLRCGRRLSWSSLLFLAVAAAILLPAAARPQPGASEPKTDSKETSSAKDEDQSDPPLKFQGRVVNAEGTPISGARIYILAFGENGEKPERPLAQTGDDGVFKFTSSVSKLRKALGRYWNVGSFVAVAKGYGVGESHSLYFETTGNLERTVNETWRQYVRKNGPDSPGEFSLLADHAPLVGQVIDLEGQPVAHARIEVVELWGDGRQDLDQWEKNSQAKDVRIDRLLQRLGGVLMQKQTEFLFPTVKADAEGRFQVHGLGRNRVAKLLIGGPGIETVQVYARTRQGRKLQVFTTGRQPSRGASTVYGAKFTHVAAPSVAVVGVVRDKDSGKPLEGVVIQSYQLAGNPVAGWDSDFIQAVTDRQGRYRLEGLPLGNNEILAKPAKDQPYLMSRRGVRLESNAKSPKNDNANSGAVTADFELKRGVWVQGRVTDQATGKPLLGTVNYFAYRDNPHVASAPGFNGAWIQGHYRADHDGRYKIPVLPGRGILTVTADDHEAYPRGAGAELLDNGKLFDLKKFIRTTPMYFVPFNHHAVRGINPKADARKVDINFALRSGRRLVGRIVGPDGEPLTGAWYSGLMEFPSWRRAEGSAFHVNYYHSDQPRRVLVVHHQKKLAGSLLIEGDDPQNVTVRLGRWSAIEGRLVDESGAPRENISLYSGGESDLQADQQGVFPPNPGPTPGAYDQVYYTDEQGRFRVGGLIPGFAYNIKATQNNFHLGQVTFDLKLKPGEWRRLGDIKIRPADREGQTSPLEDKAPKNAAKSSPVKTVSGRVLGPDGKPFAGAKVFLRHPSKKESASKRQTITDPQGRFVFDVRPEQWDRSVREDPWTVARLIAAAQGYGADWTGSIDLSPDKKPPQEITLRLAGDVPIRGRVLDLEGQPVRGARVRVRQIIEPPAKNLDAYIQSIRAGEKQSAINTTNKIWWETLPGQPEWISVDSAGRFELKGIGGERIVELFIQGPAIHFALTTVLTRPMESFALPADRWSVGPTYKIYGASFDHFAAAGRAIRGVVRDKKTGRPLAGVRVRGGRTAVGFIGYRTTDAKGRYEIPGCAKTQQYHIHANPVGQPFFGSAVKIEDTTGLGPLEANFELTRGIQLQGRVTDKTTEKPVKGQIQYYALYPNRHIDQLGERTPRPIASTSIGDDGAYSIAVLPGPGVLAVSAQGYYEKYMPALVTAEDLKKAFPTKKLGFGDNDPVSDGRILTIAAGGNSGSGIGQTNYNALELIDPAEKSDKLRRDITVDRGRRIEGKIVDPAGKPLSGATVIGLTSHVFHVNKLKTDAFTVKAVNLRRGRHLHFYHKERNLGTVLDIRGDEKGPLSVKLEPCGALVGRLLDRDGEPISRATIRLNRGRTGGPSGDPWTVTGAEGRFHLKGVVPGEMYSINVTGADPYSLGQSISVEPGETKDLGEVQRRR